jgi:hypothetical protein
MFLSVCSGYPLRGNNILGVVYDPKGGYAMLDAKNHSQPYQVHS